MSESRRNKKNNNKKETKRPVILTKREGSSKDDKSSKRCQAEETIQPKILVKPKEKETVTAPTAITIATRENHEVAPQNASSVNIQCKERESVHSPVHVTIDQPVHPVSQMTRPLSLIPNHQTFFVNPNASKLIIKTNTDFFVVGVVGTQGVGKSTIMNLLASEENNVNIAKYFFEDKEGVFSTKSKTGKLSSSPHTDTIQMFITKDRMILIDCPPILCNSHREDATTNEMDDMKMLIFLLTACHVVIIVQDDYFNLNLIRLLQFAELAKPSPDNKSFVSDFFPNILFVRNNAKRVDFLAEEKRKIESILRYFFKRSQLKIFVGQNNRHKKGKQLDDEKSVNYFVFPEVKGDTLSAYHPSLELLVMDLRNRVFMSPRNQIYNGTTELTEGIWFDLITATSQKTNFFLTQYLEIRRNHATDTTNAKSSMIYTDMD